MSLSCKIIPSRLTNITLCFVILILCLLSITFLTGSIFGANLSGNNTSALTYSTNQDISFTFAPSLSITLSDTDLVIDTLAPGNTAESNTITVSVASNTPYGYALYADAGSNDTSSKYYNTSDLIRSDNINAVFTSIAINASLPTLTTDNTWGYSISKNNGTTWSTYNGLPTATSTGGSTSTDNPAVLIDTTLPADSQSITLKVAARSSSTQASGAYSNIINFYAVGKPTPPTLYEEVAKMSKGPQTATDLQATITTPTSADYRNDTSNSGVYEYNATLFGESSDASNTNTIYYYRGVLERTMDQGSYGSDGKATTYPNYVRLGNNTCWRIVRTTGSGGVKMIYNGTWTGSTCAHSKRGTETITMAFAIKGTSTQASFSWYSNIHYVGYTFNNNVTDSNTEASVDTVFGSDANPSLNNTRSNIKIYLEDTWYKGNMMTYTNLLEPSAGYCNDRTAYSTETTTAALADITPYRTSDASMYFGAYGRNKNATNAGKTPSLTCPRSTVDLYRYVPNSAGVSNELKYPVALLTADELSLAGSGSYTASQGSSYNAKSFLNSGSNFWLLSPSHRFSNGYALVFALSSGGSFYDYYVSDNEGVRPTISLKSGTHAISGAGTATDPWLISE